MDAVGGHHGTLNGTTPAPDRLGNPTGALSFDGVNDYVDFGDAPDLRIGYPMTVAAWIRLRPGSLGSVFRNNYVENRYQGLLVTAQADVPLRVQVGDGDCTCPSGRRGLTGTTVLSPGVWTHVAAVVLSPTDMQLYVNGIDDQAVAGDGTGGPMEYGVGRATLGIEDSSNFLPPHFLSGEVDDLCFFGRALTPAEVLDLADSDVTPPILTCPPLVLEIVAKSGVAGEAVFFSVAAQDDRDPAPTVLCVPPSGSFFPRGTTLVTCTATDASGNQSVCQFPVIVRPTVRER
jgi:hypothetical protein